MLFQWKEGAIVMGFHGKEQEDIVESAISRYHHHSIDACVQDEGAEI